MANDLTFAMGGDISAFERAMTTAVTTGAKNFAKIEAACRASSQRIDGQFGTAFTRMLGGVGSVERALGALKIAGAVFVGFELLKSIIDSIEDSAGQASKEIGHMAEIARKARDVGVGTDFFQGFTESVKKLGLDATQAEAILKSARDALDLKVGEGENGSNTSTALDRVKQNVLAGNLKEGDAEALQNADGLQDKERVVLNLLDELQSKSENLAAFDLAGKVFGPDFETRLRNGENIIGAMRDAMGGLAGAEAARLIPAQDIAHAEEQQAEQASQNARIQALLADYELLVKEYNQGNLDIVLELKDAFISTAEEVKKLVQLLNSGAKALGDWDVGLGKFTQMLGSGAVHDVLAKYGLTVDGPKSPFGGLDGARAAFAGPRPLDIRKDQSKVLPSLTPPASDHASTAKQADEVENLIKSLSKAAAAEQGEADAVGLSNKAKQESIDLAKAEEAAKERGTALTAAERTQIIGLADSYSAAKQRIDDFTKAQDALKQGMDEVRDAAKGALSGFIDDLKNGKGFGQAFADVLSGIESKVLSLAENSVIDELLGKQGTTGTGAGSGAAGGLLSTLVSGLGGNFQGWMPHFASGGLVNGAGGGTTDSIAAMLSHGEYVVPAKAAAANGALLDAIASGKPLRMAQPMAVNAGGAARMVTNATSSTTVNMHVNTPDAPSFARSEGQISGLLARAVGRGQRNA